MKERNEKVIMAAKRTAEGLIDLNQELLEISDFNIQNGEVEVELRDVETGETKWF